MDETFDFTTVAVQDVEEGPEYAGGRRKYEVNPFLDWMKDSWEKEIGKEIVLAPKMVKDAMALIRQAAEDMTREYGQDIGAKIRLYAKGALVQQTAVGDLNPNTKVTVKFWATEKRGYRKNQDETQTSEDTQTPE